MICVGKAAVDPSKERVRCKEVDSWNSYQPIDLNCWMVHENTVKKDTYNTAISQYLIKVREMIELPLRHPEIFEKLGIEAPKGVSPFSAILKTVFCVIKTA